MNLESYINLYQLLQNKHTTHKDNRVFGLEHQGKKQIAQLLSWTEHHQSSLSEPLGERVSKYFYGVSLVLGIVALVLGIFSGIGMLSYNGGEPVNMVYFLVMAVLVPLFTMSLGIVAMFRVGTARSTLVHISPSFWMEKIWSLLSGDKYKHLQGFKINPLLLNWLAIKRSQLLAWLFSLGLLLALLGAVTTKDLAFAWSTTLDISAEDFHQFMSLIALPWKEWLPSAVPSLELIEHSQYFRLGKGPDESMAANARLLGEWWKFLAVSALFYAILLRTFVWFFAAWAYKRVLRKSFLEIAGVDSLLYEMNTPLLDTTSPKSEETFMQSDSTYDRILFKISVQYEMILGWAMTEDDIRVATDSLGIKSKDIYSVGGTKSISEDSAVIAKCSLDIPVFVKSWEPPTMDIMDFLGDLSVEVDRIVIVPLGMSESSHKARLQDVEVWIRKLQNIDNKKVWLWQEN